MFFGLTSLTNKLPLNFMLPVSASLTLFYRSSFFSSSSFSLFSFTLPSSRLFRANEVLAVPTQS
ncbi:hypothetical protein AXX17_AT1G52970 [Arabidopsis thaliana]|uniref:Uncharacterized protein n=1 Tax=Arabidopsis thaliana TaxID=3702 RepID=A0A178WBV8_ARATH|nr:hypothetical protein AXX17_AT1G52970 [Arabidopsis thaliana]